MISKMVNSAESDIARSDIWTGARAASFLSLAATPTFAVMAILTGVHGGNMPDAIDASPLAGMVPMYVLMSAFHSAPWLKLIFRKRDPAATQKEHFVPRE